MIEEIYQQLQCFLAAVNLHWPIEILCGVTPENLEVEISRIIEKWGFFRVGMLVFGVKSRVRWVNL